jgi:hypothetical protein
MSSVLYTSSAPHDLREYWMRATPLLGIRRLGMAAVSSDRPLAAKELNKLLLSLHIVECGDGRASVGPTTLYHYRRAAERLGVLVRQGRRLTPNMADRDVREFLDPARADMTDSVVRGAAWRIVTRCAEPKRFFFDLFVIGGTEYDSGDFTLRASPVGWRTYREDRRTFASLTNLATGAECVLDGPVKVSSIIYGVRYWAKNELCVIDEYYEHGTEHDRVVMYPTQDGSEQAAKDLLAERLDRSAEWSTLSLRELITAGCVPRRIRREVLYRKIAALKASMPDSVVMIPAPPSLAALTARSRGQADLQLQNYMKYGNAYVSHVRIHSEAGRFLDEKANSGVQ